MTRTPAPRVSPLLRSHLFGSFRIERGQERINLPTRKAESLFAYLILHPQQHDRERIAGLFWGETLDSQARMSLRTALVSLRKCLGPELFIIDRDTLQLNPGYPLWADVIEFSRMADRLTLLTPLELERALSLYQDDLLAGFYDDWLHSERNRYRALFVDMTCRLIQELRSRGEYVRAIHWAQKVLSIEPANEKAHQHLMVCYSASGDRGAALRQYQECCRALQVELDVRPQPETVTLYEQLKMRDSAVQSPEASLTNLPLPVTSFIGRAQDLTEIRQALLTTTTRLLTLTGAGGCGKTRLAIEVTRGLAGKYRDGLWWADLSELTDPALVLQVVAKILGVRESPTRTLEVALKATLSTKQILLILDNCEHLLPTTARLVSELLSVSPGLQILATSREAFGLAGEVVWRVSPLPYPEVEELPLDVRDLVPYLMTYDAVRLFVDRASAVRGTPSFVLSPENGPFVAQLCCQLDGLPLAIELTSARVRTLGIAELAARLEASFQVIDGAHRAAVPRHQTLEALIDWSFCLLSGAERHLLQQLAIFERGWTLAAAEYVCEGAGDDVVELLSHLVDKSLVVVEEHDVEIRYRLLETIRQYARRRLEASGEMDLVRGRHLDWFLRLAEEAEPKLRGEEQPQWMKRLETENDNLRAALNWSLREDGINSDVVEKGILLAGALGYFWIIPTNLTEATLWLGQAVQKSHDGAGRATPGRTKALCSAGMLNVFQRDWPRVSALCEEVVSMSDSIGDYGSMTLAVFMLAQYQLNYTHDFSKARELAEEGLALAKERGDWWGMSAVCFVQGALMQFQGDREQAQRMFEKGVALLHQVGDPWLTGAMLDSLGEYKHALGDYAAAAAIYAESLASRRLLRDKGGMAGTLNNLGRLARHQGDLVRAAEFYRESMALFGELGLGEYVAFVKHNLACVMYLRGDRTRAAELFKESLVQARQSGNRDVLAKCIIGLAVAGAANSGWADSVRTYAAAQAHLHKSNAKLSTLNDVDDVDSAPFLDAARTTLGDQTVDALMKEGASLSLEEAAHRVLD